jgi:hypothetical protein
MAMKVNKVIEMLTKNYELDDELFITWWDKEVAESYVGDTLTNTQWQNIIEQLDEDEHLFTSVAEAVHEYHDREVTV